MADLEIPDGFTAPPAGLQAPDGFTAQVAPQMGGPMRAPALIASNALKGALTGAGAIGDLQDLIGQGFDKYIYDPLHKAVTGQPMPPRPDYLPAGSPLDSAHLQMPAQAVGAVDNPALTPQGAGERYAAAAAQGAGGMAPYLALGGGGGLIGALRNVAQGAGAGVGGQAGADLFPNHPALAQAAGGVVGALAAGKGLNFLNRAGGVAAGASTPTLDAYRNLGIDPALAGDVTGSPTLQMMQAFAAKAPGGAGRVHAASEHAVGQWGSALEDTAANLDPGVGAPRAATLQGAGDVLQAQGQNWLNQWKQASRQAWNNVAMRIPPATPTPLTDYAQTLSNIRNTMPNAPATADVLQPSLSQKLLTSLISDTKQGPLTWQDAAGIRTRIGEMLGDPQLVGDTGYAELKRLYGALSNDLQSAAGARGPRALAAFNKANAVTRNGHDFVENVLSNFMTRGVAPADAAAKALNTAYNGGTTLQAIRDQMPTAADALAAYKLRDMALANAGQQNAAASRLSPGTFVTDAAKLAPEARDALFGADPYTAQRVSDLLTAGGAMKATERFLNTSNTGAHAAVGHALGGALSLGPAIAGYEAGGLPGAAVGWAGGALAPWLIGQGAARLTASPAITRALAAAPAVSLPPSAPLGIAAYPQVRGLLPLP